MNNSTSRKICEHIQHLVVNAAELTIDERGFWGLGHIDIHPDLQSFTLTAQEKYYVQIVSAKKRIDEVWQSQNNTETDIEPYYGTDWTAVCSMHGALRDLFLSYGFDSQFEFDIEHNENYGFVLTTKSQLKIHYVHHKFSSINDLNNSQIDELYEQLTKLTLFSFMSQ